MNNATIIAQIETTLRNKITAECGGKLITCSEGALLQMDELANLIVEITDYSEDKLTEDDLEVAKIFAEMFGKEHMSGEIVDGVMVPQQDVDFEIIKATVKEQVASFSLSTTLPVVLLNKIVQEVKQFTR